MNARLSASAAAVVMLMVLPAFRLHAADAVPSTASLREAAERTLPLLIKAAAGHRTKRTCFSCHSQGVPLVALSEAKKRGFDIDKSEIESQRSAILAFLVINQSNFREGKGTGGRVDTAGYALWALSAVGQPANEATAAVCEYLLLYKPDLDHWPASADRPPSEADAFTTTSLAMRGLQNFGTPGQQPRIAAKLAKVEGWLSKTRASDTEGRVFRLHALKAADVPSSEIAAAVADLKDSQNEDGGWSQASEMDSDAYATGTALVALNLAGEVPTDGSTYSRGLQYLIETQLDDGSWHVKSRSKPFQTYFETGFPHAKDQFISAAASAWATLAIVLACDGPPAEEK
jgi:hypothetical protein